MRRTVTLAIDVMGGDMGPAVTVPAALDCAAADPGLRLILVGDQLCIEQYLQQRPSLEERVKVCHAAQVVGMDERPSIALRCKKESSMRMAIDLVRSGEADACVSAGNTGALMAIGRFVLKTYPGIDRPAIIAAIPTLGGHSLMLDLGANVDCQSEHLLQFAVMGAVVSAAVEGVDNPRVGLLNIGEEEIKGNEQVKLASRLLAENDSLNYIGYLEGDDIFQGVADVVVCDGFVGNVALKTSEGLAGMLTRVVEQVFARNWYSRLVGVLAKPVLRKLRQHMDPGRHNGASVLGLQGIVVKSHGSASRQEFACAMRRAVREVEQDVPALINRRIGQLLNHAQAG